MNKDEVRNIIEATLKAGEKTPGLFDLPKIMGIKSKLESCSSIEGVVGILEEHRGLLCKAFGLDNDAFCQGVEKLKALDVAVG
jgi:hypothetical protein